MGSYMKEMLQYKKCDLPVTVMYISLLSFHDLTYNLQILHGDINSEIHLHWCLLHV